MDNVNIMASKNHQLIIKFGNNCQLRDGILRSPVLYGLNKKKIVIKWQIFIGIGAMDGDDLSMDRVEKPLYESEPNSIDAMLPDDYVGVYWTKHGQENGKIQETTKTIVYAGKNIGKKNATTAFTQALFDARSTYEDKIKDGYMLNRDTLLAQNVAPSIESLMKITERGEFPWRVHGMALHNYSKFAAKIKFPAAIQDKRDGHMCIVVGHPALTAAHTGQKIDGIDIYSRGRESYPALDYIATEMQTICQTYPGLHFVGELWKAGHSLQEISSACRNESADDDNRLRVVFNIFDCFYLGDDRNFKARQQILQTAIIQNLPYVVVIPTKEVINKAEVEAIHAEHMAAGMEGSVIRNWSGQYEYSVNKEVRSYDTQKIKPRDDAEWPCVGYSTGKGKEAGLVKWICAESDDGVVQRTGKKLPLNDRKTFNVTPNQTEEVRRAIYDKLEADPELMKKIYGALITITYSILSDDYLPQQPKMLRFRDALITEMLD